MKIYKANTTTITVLGVAYFADGNGVIDVPDNKVGSSIWGQGFVCADGYLAELGRLSNQASTSADQAVAKTIEAAGIDPVKKPVSTEKPKPL